MLPDRSMDGKINKKFKIYIDQFAFECNIILFNIS